MDRPKHRVVEDYDRVLENLESIITGESTKCIRELKFDIFEPQDDFERIEQIERELI